MPEQSRANSYCRVVRVKNDPTRIDQGIELFKEELLPILKKQKGFGGTSLLGSRKTGDTMTITFWESEAAMKAAHGQVRPESLKRLGELGGRIVEDDECEVAMLERFKPPESHVWARVTTVQGDPAQADKSIANFKETIVPAIKNQSGARTAFFYVNRQAGKSIAGSVWDTEQDLQASESSIGKLRSESVKKFGGHDPRIELFEIYFTEILTPASVR